MTSSTAVKDWSRMDLIAWWMYLSPLYTGRQTLTRGQSCRPDVRSTAFDCCFIWRTLIWCLHPLGHQPPLGTITDSVRAVNRSVYEAQTHLLTSLSPSTTVAFPHC